MSAEERTAADAVYVLDVLAELVRASPHQAEQPEWAEIHAGYLEDIAQAVARDAGLPAEELADGAKYASGEWRSALALSLFGGDNATTVLRRASANR